MPELLGEPPTESADDRANRVPTLRATQEAACQREAAITHADVRKPRLDTAQELCAANRGQAGGGSESSADRADADPHCMRCAGGDEPQYQDATRSATIRFHMPYRLTWERDGLYRQYHGDVTIAERRASFDAICSDPRFDNLRYVITDYLEVTTYEVTTTATAEIAALHIGPLITNPRLVIAAVAVRPDVLAAIRDFIGHGFTTNPYRVFSTLEEARRWVGVPPRG